MCFRAVTIYPYGHNDVKNCVSVFLTNLRHYDRLAKVAFTVKNSEDYLTQGIRKQSLNPRFVMIYR